MDSITIGELVGMCTSFTVIGTFIGGIMMFCYKTFIKPNKDTIQKHKDDIEEVNEKLLNDYRRLEEFEKTMRTIAKGMYLIEQHIVFGNHVDKLKEHLDEFTEVLIEK